MLAVFRSAVSFRGVGARLNAARSRWTCRLLDACRPPCNTDKGFWGGEGGEGDVYLQALAAVF